jgi:hypothetical protein
MKRIKTKNSCLKSKKHLCDLKTRSGSYSDLDITTQAKKQPLKCHTACPLKEKVQEINTLHTPKCQFGADTEKVDL